MQYAHDRDVIHRDIKPENILLQAGHPLVADFGIALAISRAGGARITETGLSLGTPEYMSPEQATGDRDLDARSDIYALACVAYELLTGEPPHTGPTAQAIVTRILSEPVRPATAVRSTIPAAVDAALLTALAKLPADRFSSMTAFMAAFEAEVPRARRRWWLTGVLAAIVAVGLLTAIATGWPFRTVRGGPGESGGVVTMAVMPFVMVGGDGSDDYLAEGVAEELIDALTDVEALRVASWNSAFMLRDEADVRVIGDRLGVSLVLEGSVRSSPEGLRVRAELSDAGSGFARWSETFVSPPSELFTVPPRITRALAAELQITLDSGGATDPQVEVESGEAFNLYLRGRYHWNRRTEEELGRAVESFEQAVTLAPTFARAYAGLGDTYAVMGFYDYRSPAEAFQNARAAAKAAVDLDPTLADPHATLGYVALYYDWNWTDSEREFRQAIALDSTYALAFTWYANHLTAMGRFDEARAANAKALELEPLSPIMNVVPGWISFYAGDLRRAVTELDSAIALHPYFPVSYVVAGMAYEQLGELDSAVASLEQAVEMSGGSDLMVADLAHAYARAGARDTAVSLLESLEEASGERYVPAFEIAKVYQALGDEARALQWLERAYEARSHSMAFLKVDPQLAPLRSEPAFQSLMIKVGHN